MHFARLQQMSDHVVFHIKGSGLSVVSRFYGEFAIALLKIALSEMCMGNPHCSSARLIGVLHNYSKCNGFLATMPGPFDLEDATLRRLSKGDAGIVIYDCNSGEVSCHHGYLAEQHLTPFFIGKPREFTAGGKRQNPSSIS